MQAGDSQRSSEHTLYCRSDGLPLIGTVLRMTGSWAG